MTGGVDSVTAAAGATVNVGVAVTLGGDDGEGEGDGATTGAFVATVEGMAGIVAAA